MSSRLRGWRVASVIAGLWVLGTVAALALTLQSLSETSFDGMNNWAQIPFAMPWFLIPRRSDYVLNAWIDAAFGLLNAALIYRWIARRQPVCSS